jgi:2'-5' RNA ligase
MSVFVAIDIDPGVLGAIGSLQRELGRDMPSSKGVKWVRPDLIHLTLKFLGDLDQAAADKACRVVAHAALRQAGFTVNVSGLGVFGRPARVLWAGIDRSYELGRFRASLEKYLVKAGMEADRQKYSPHLTIARVNNFKASKSVAQLAKEHRTVQLGSFFADSVCMYKSELTSGGPEYTLLSRTKLQ